MNIQTEKGAKHVCICLYIHLYVYAYVCVYIYSPVTYM